MHALIRHAYAEFKTEIHDRSPKHIDRYVGCQLMQEESKITVVAIQKQRDEETSADHRLGIWTRSETAIENLHIQIPLLLRL